MLRFALLLIAVATAPAAWAQMPPTVVRTGVAVMREVQNHHRVTGSLRAVARGDVSALEEGRILEITVREGVSVKNGDVIARLDTRRLKAQKSELTAAVSTAQAMVQQRRVELEQTERDLARSEQLVKTRALTVEEHQHRQTDVAVAAARLATAERRVTEAESQLELLEVRLDDMVVRAPYDGRVVARHSEPGEWIKSGEPFVTLVSSGQVEAWLDVPERYAQTLDRQRVSIVATGIEEPIVSRSAKVVPDFDTRTRTFPLVLTLDDQQGRLAPGMSINAWLPVGKLEHRLAVPKDAVIRSGRTAYVYKAVEQEGSTVAVQTPISIAFETGDALMLAGGDLREGDRVIVEGNERLTPGMPVTLATPTDSQRSGDEKYAAARKR